MANWILLIILMVPALYSLGTFAVAGLLAKCRKKARQGFRENMAFVGILSTQILYDRFIENFSDAQVDNLLPEKVRVIVQ